MSVVVKHAILREAVNSVAIEHGGDCDCVTCRAASGDRDAFERVWIEVFE